MQGLRPVSILLGVLVDKAVFVACAVALGAMLGISSPRFQNLALLFGLASTGLGGFTAARHARARHIAHGLAVGFIALALSLARFGIHQVWPPSEAGAQHPLWWELIGWAGAPGRDTWAAGLRVSERHAATASACPVH